VKTVLHKRVDAVEKLYVADGRRRLTFNFIVLPFGRMTFSGHPHNRTFRLVQEFYQSFYVLGRCRQNELLLNVSQTTQPKLAEPDLIA